MALYPYNGFLTSSKWFCTPTTAFLTSSKWFCTPTMAFLTSSKWFCNGLKSVLRFNNSQLIISFVTYKNNLYNSLWTVKNNNS